MKGAVLQPGRKFSDSSTCTGPFSREREGSGRGGGSRPRAEAGPLLSLPSTRLGELLRGGSVDPGVCGSRVLRVQECVRKLKCVRKRTCT